MNVAWRRMHLKDSENFQALPCFCSLDSRLHCSGDVYLKQSREGPHELDNLFPTILLSALQLVVHDCIH